MHKVNPTPQEIKDKDVAVHNFLLDLAEQVTDENAPEVTARLLAVGLSAIHERLGDMWCWEKTYRS